jgi:ribosomal protein S18 acetylase RimI-like enzyme
VNKNKKIKIRISVPSDVFGIREVQKRTWIDTYPNVVLGIKLKDIKDEFKKDNTSDGITKIEARKKGYKDKNRKIWVAEYDDRIIGFCIAIYKEKEARIKAIYILPEHQNKGIGGSLMKKAMKWLGDNKKIYINVVEYNLKAINFYKKYGFLETKRKKDFNLTVALPSGKIMPEIELVKKV